MSEHEMSECEHAWQNWYNTSEPSFMCINDGENDGIVYEVNSPSED